jgi:hypothetical protein
VRETHAEVAPEAFKHGDTLVEIAKTYDVSHNTMAHGSILTKKHARLPGVG